jgi:ferric-dicitrate binding protein FerR (iron transport regulator)
MQSPYQLYKDFSVEAFLLDETFLDWIKTPTEEKDLFWEQFLKAYPEKRTDLETAKLLAGKLDFMSHQPASDSADRIWKRILEESKKGRVVSFSRNLWWAAAAVLIFIIAGSIWLVNQRNWTTVQTALGQIKNIELPDGSHVVLNANSMLKYKKEWSHRMIREVWIDGAGFLEVVHKNKAGMPVQPSERFIVHLKNMNVEVLGTTFTVTSRRNLEQVVLETGSVKVTQKGADSSIYLRPGELAQYSVEKKTLYKREANAAELITLKDNRFKFNNTPLSEIEQLIEDTYGYQVVITDTILLERKLSGTLSSQNKEVLFRALETMLDVKITLSGQTVTISYK